MSEELSSEESIAIPVPSGVPQGFADPESVTDEAIARYAPGHAGTTLEELPAPLQRRVLRMAKKSEGKA